jgi:hypothetical protein
MPFASLPINSSLQNNPTYQFWLKLENIEILPIFENKNDPECNFHHYQSIPLFKITLEINFHWNRRPLTIWRFCWQSFWKWWPRKNDPECKFHHYQSIPDFKITLDINFHWNQRTLKFCRFCRRPFSKWQPFARNFF